MIYIYNYIYRHIISYEWANNLWNKSHTLTIPYHHITIDGSGVPRTPYESPMIGA